MCACLALSCEVLSTTVWALATFHLEDSGLFVACAKEARSRLDDFKAQELSNTTWSFARLGMDGLIHAVADKAMRPVMHWRSDSPSAQLSTGHGGHEHCWTAFEAESVIGDLKLL